MWMPCWRITHECDSGFTDFGSVTRRSVALVGRRLLVWQKTVGILTSLLMVAISALLVVKVVGGTAPLVLHTGRLGGTSWDHAGRRYVSSSVAVA